MTLPSQSAGHPFASKTLMLARLRDMHRFAENGELGPYNAQEVDQIADYLTDAPDLLDENSKFKGQRDELAAVLEGILVRLAPQEPLARAAFQEARVLLSKLKEAGS